MEVEARKTNEGATIPTKATANSECYDITAIDTIEIHPGDTYLAMTGIALQMPKNLYAEITGRSSLALRGIAVHPGTIDQDYEGEIGVILHNVSNATQCINVGQRYAQIKLKDRCPAKLISNHECSKTRGTGGFGSSGDAQELQFTLE